MFTEADWQNTREVKAGKKGWIEIIVGCMFSGKTEELIRRVNRALIAKQKVAIFKPIIDTRYHLENVVSHNDNFLKSTAISSSLELVSLSEEAEVIAIDEVQFFDDKIGDVCTILANKGKRLILAGLDLDYKGVAFVNTSQLMALAEYVTKIHAICVVCGSAASFSFRISSSGDKILVGNEDNYEARCRECFNRG